MSKDAGADGGGDGHGVGEKSKAGGAKIHPVVWVIIALVVFSTGLANDVLGFVNGVFRMINVNTPVFFTILAVVWGFVAISKWRDKNK